MIFDKPHWSWRVAAAAESYGFVRGVVHVYPERGATRRAYVVVPSEFFQLLTSVMSEKTLARAAAEGVQFYLDDLGGGRWAFGFVIGGDIYNDMWPYTRSTLPLWFDRAKPV